MNNGIRISSAAVSERGLSEKRPQNEDSFLEMSRIGIFAVADGVGGAQAGEVASQMAMEILGEAFANLQNGSDADDVMKTAIERANAAIYQMASELPQLANMATTIVALHLAGNIATIGHVGDSRLYSVDREGRLTRETDDHSMVAEEVRAGRMTEEQAENHPSRNIISRALGAEPTVQVDIKTIMVEPGTSFLICSDGVTRHVGDQEIKGVLTFGGDPIDICEYLKGLCYERGAEDNLTAVVVKISGTQEALPPPAPAFELLEEDEPTVATARSPFETQAASDKDEIELLELDTRELQVPERYEDPEPLTEDFTASVGQTFVVEPDEVTRRGTEPEGEIVSTVEPESTSVAANEATVAGQETTQNDAFSMFGDSGEPNAEELKPSVLGKVAAAVGLLLLGGLLGASVYHFSLTLKSVEPPKPQLSEMKAANIPLSAFEENRRDVDKDPAGYLQKNLTPQDAEDYYLVGRAYLLTGDFPKAHNAFVESRNRLGGADPINSQVLKDDLAVSIAVTNDTTIQSIVKKELEPAKGAANTNSNGTNNR